MMSAGFTDIHAHFVFGVDDGAQSAEDMYAMLDAAASDGVEILYASSHIAPGLQPFDTPLYEERVSCAKQYCAAQGYDLQVLPGAEILCSPMIERTAKEHRLRALGGSDTVLLEFAPQTAFSEMISAVHMIRQCGYDIILAHIERYECLYGKGAWRLKDKADVKYQVNCSTALEESAYVRGMIRRMTVRKWFSDGLIDFIASDAHDISRRPSRMRAAYGEIARRYGQDEADRMMCAGRIL